VELTGKLLDLFDWMLDGVPGAKNPVAVIERFANDIRSSGVPVDRFVAFVRTLHPQVAGRAFYWTPGSPVDVRETAWATLFDWHVQTSPIGLIFRDGVELRFRLGDATGDAGERHALLRDLVALANEGYTDYLALPLRFTSGHNHAVAFATKRPGGFTDDDLAKLRQVTRALARVAEALALTRTAANLLSAYVGRNAGARVLDGQVQRGAVDEIRCVVWFSDMRGFTEMSSTCSPIEVVARLNKFFDAQVTAIEAHGGEVLKFIGDGLFAIFPLDNAVATEVCAAALAATRDARDRVAETDASFGIALHVGEVAYGNIGGADRLDFTCIGTAVNTAARIESLTGKLGHQVLVSEAFATTAGMTGKPVGSFELKGIAGAQSVWAP
jgi:adenylate cyclase